MKTRNLKQRLADSWALRRPMTASRSFASDKPRLVLRLAEAATLEWLIASGTAPQVVAQGQGTPAQIADMLAGYPGITSACVLVPTTDVTFHTLTIPPQARRQLQQALPFMLEEQVATDVETLHCVVLAWRDEQATVAVVAKEKMRQWLAVCAALALKIDSLYPDALVLPQHATELTALQHGDQWLFRHPTGVGMAAEVEWYAALLALPLPGASAVPTPDPAAPVDGVENAALSLRGHSYSLPVPALGTWTPQPVASLLALAASAPAPLPLGLLHGEFAPANAWRARWHAWRSVAALAGCYLLLLLGDAAWQHYHAYQQAAWWREETVRVYRQIFPAETQVVNPRVQMQQHLQRSGAAQDTPSVLAQMSRLQTLMTQNPDIRLQSLAYEGNRREIRLALTAPGYAELEQFQQQAETHYQIQPGEIRQNGPRVEALMTLREQP